MAKILKILIIFANFLTVFSNYFIFFSYFSFSSSQACSTISLHDASVHKAFNLDGYTIPQFHFKGLRSKLSEYRKMRANFEINFSLARFMFYMARSVPYYGNFSCWIDCNYFWNHVWFMWGNILIKWQKFGNICQKIFNF